jgi:hypothetical protein
VTDCKLSGNTKGIRVQADTARDHHVNNCEISNNTQAGVEASIPNGENLDATNNYWGSPSGPSAPNGAVGQVTFTPFLSAPPGGPHAPDPADAAHTSNAADPAHSACGRLCRVCRGSRQ